MITPEGIEVVKSGIQRIGREAKAIFTPRQMSEEEAEVLRNMLITGTTAASALVLASYLPEFTPSVLAADKPWTSPRWWPIFPETAASHKLPRFIDVDINGKEGTLQTHDRVAWEIFGYRTDALGEGIEKFQSVIDNHPEMASYAGYCPPEAAAGIFEAEPQDGMYSKIVKEGLLVAKHAGDPVVTSSIEAMKTLLTSHRIGGSWGVLVNAPDPGVNGIWMRAAYGIDGSYIWVTAWGAGHIKIPISQIQEVWTVVNDPLGTSEIDETMIELRKRTGSWQLKELNLDVVDYVAAS